MVRRMHRLLSVVLSVLMVLSVVAVASVSAAAGDTVYCQNDANWGEVYCYMWSDSLGDNGSWPGQKMTQGSDGLWSYSVSKDWNMIIFNNGGNGIQTGDLTYQGNGSCYNNQTNSWSVVDDVPENTTPSTAPTVTPTPSPSGTNVVYCQNDANWSTVSVYMWNGNGSSNNGSWPGQTATNIGDGIWMLEYEGEYTNIIFSQNGGNQTSDLSHPGSGQMYNNSTGAWTLFDPSQLHIKSVTADPASPQYTGVEIQLSIVAGGGEGDLLYKFAAGNTVISDYSADSTVTWVPSTAGTYTMTYSVKDEAGNVKEQTATYTIKDINSEVKPVIQCVDVTPTNSESNELKKGQQATVDITAGGGNTGTKLLFYKVKITDPSGNTANVPYYTLSEQYKFTPTTLGTYEISVSVQGSDNSTVTRTYEYECVAELSQPGELKATVSTTGGQAVGSTVTLTASASGGTSPYTYQFAVNGQIVQAYSSTKSYALAISAEGTYSITVSVKDSSGDVATKSTSFTVSSGNTSTDAYLKGDADCNGVVNVKDATAIQKHLAELEILTDQGLINGEVDGSGNLTVKDATTIQKHIAGIDVDW